jgi:hypothetical protein
MSDDGHERSRHEATSVGNTPHVDGERHTDRPRDGTDNTGVRAGSVRAAAVSRMAYRTIQRSTRQHPLPQPRPSPSTRTASC